MTLYIAHSAVLFLYCCLLIVELKKEWKQVWMTQNRCRNNPNGKNHKLRSYCHVFFSCKIAFLNHKTYKKLCIINGASLAPPGGRRRAAQARWRPSWGQRAAQVSQRLFTRSAVCESRKQASEPSVGAVTVLSLGSRPAVPLFVWIKHRNHRNKPARLNPLLTQLLRSGSVPVRSERRDAFSPAEHVQVVVEVTAEADLCLFACCCCFISSSQCWGSPAGSSAPHVGFRLERSGGKSKFPLQKSQYMCTKRQYDVQKFYTCKWKAWLEKLY